MAATNRSLFSWNDVENLPDLKRLSLVNELKGFFLGTSPIVEFIGLICIPKLASSREL